MSDSYPLDTIRRQHEEIERQAARIAELDKTAAGLMIGYGEALEKVAALTAQLATAREGLAKAEEFLRLSDRELSWNSSMDQVEHALKIIAGALTAINAKETAT